ncbi:MAG: hypothetical protein ABSG31_04350 [Tepidisphaeraceae bacterium]
MKIHIRILATLLAVSVLLAERAFCPADDSVPGQTSTSQVTVQYAKGDTEIDTMKVGANVWIGSDATYQDFPAEITGLTFTRHHQYSAEDVTLDIPNNTTVYLMFGNGTRLPVLNRPYGDRAVVSE